MKYIHNENYNLKLEKKSSKYDMFTGLNVDVTTKVVL